MTFWRIIIYYLIIIIKYPSGAVKWCRKKSLAASLTALSGTTKKIFTAAPLYMPKNPSDRYVFRKQSNLFKQLFNLYSDFNWISQIKQEKLRLRLMHYIDLYIFSPFGPICWFCNLVFTKSKGNIHIKANIAPIPAFMSFGNSLQTKQHAWEKNWSFVISQIKFNKMNKIKWYCV